MDVDPQQPSSITLPTTSFTHSINRIPVQESAVAAAGEEKEEMMEVDELDCHQSLAQLNEREKEATELSTGKKKLNEGDLAPPSTGKRQRASNEAMNWSITKWNWPFLLHTMPVVVYQCVEFII
jgi:hypothetical protein